MIVTPAALGLGILFDRSPDAVLVAEAESGRILLWNAGATALFGHGPDEATGRPLTSLGLPGEALTGLGPTPSEHPFEALTCDGHRLPAVASLSTFAHPESGETLVLAMIRSVAATPRIAERPCDQGALVARLLDSLPAGMAYYGPDLRVRLVNAAYARIFNRRVEDVIGKHVMEIFGPPGRVLEEVLGRIVETGEPIHSFNLAGTYHFGGQAYEGVWDVTRNPILDEAGRVAGIVVLMQDVTERARLNAEIERRTEELAEQKALTERIIQHAPVMMAFIDRDLVYRWNNPIHARLFGVAREDLIGRSVCDVLPDAALARTTALYQQVIDTKQPQRLDGVPFGKAGDQSVYWDVDYVPVFDEHEEVAGILVLAVDASDRLERERLHQQQIAHLQQVDRMKDQFLSILSHELRTPLNAIMGFASILDDELMGTLNANQHQFLTKIMSGTEVLLALINDLLDMSRIQAGKFSLQPAPTDVGAVVREAVDHLAVLADRKGHTLAITVPDGLAPITADAQRVKQVLINLIGNAIKFTPDGGHIAVSVAETSSALCLQVTDDGIGISSADRARLFQPFTQVDDSNTRAAGGTGLGLSISKALVEAHGGTLNVESEVGRGSTFWFSLPRDPLNGT
jgi:PAS domain S-box-containing protein